MSVEIPLHDGAFTTWAARAAYFEQMRAKVAETPGVRMAAISSNATPPRNGGKTQFEILEKPSTEEQMTSVNRSEEHTSELQSPDPLVCRLLLEKKKQWKKRPTPANNE